jgi:YD repeat-containing protein
MFFEFVQHGVRTPGSTIARLLVQRTVSGQAQLAYLPFFSNVAPTTATLPPGPTGSGTSVSFEYDDFDRMIRRFGLEAQQIGAYTYHALSEDIYDAAHLGTLPLTVRRDGHGRTVATHQATAGDVITTSAGYLPTGEVQSIVRSHQGTGEYTRWMEYDSLGRLVFNAEPNSSTGFVPTVGGKGVQGWTYAYDIAGDLVGTSDARGCGVNFVYDGLGRLVSEDYSPCLGSQPTYTKPLANGDGTEAFFEYDIPEPGQSNAYGLSDVAYQGKLVAIQDRGEHVRVQYDGRGRLVGSAKQLAQPSAVPISTLAGRFAPSWYQVNAIYDEAGRPIARTTGAEFAGLQGNALTVGPLTSQSLVTVTYDDRSIPVAVGGSYGALVTNETYTADGLLKMRQYGDLAKTTATYDHNGNRWITRARIERDAPSLWTSGAPGYTLPTGAFTTPTVLLDAQYAKYDEVGNAREIADKRLPAEWPTTAQPISKDLVYDDL